MRTQISLSKLIECHVRCHVRFGWAPGHTGHHQFFLSEGIIIIIIIYCYGCRSGEWTKWAKFHARNPRATRSTAVFEQHDDDKLMSQVECIHPIIIFIYESSLFPIQAKLNSWTHDVHVLCVARSSNKCYTNRHSNDQSETRILAFLLSLHFIRPLVYGAIDDAVLDVFANVYGRRGTRFTISTFYTREKHRNSLATVNSNRMEGKKLKKWIDHNKTLETEARKWVAMPTSRLSICSVMLRLNFL